MRSILILVLFPICSVSLAEDPAFYEGIVVLENGDVLSGKLLMPTFELVLVVSEEGRLAVPVHKIDQVRFYDHVANLNRRFGAFSDGTSWGNQKVLFEIVLFGEIKVLRKPKSFFQDISKMKHSDYQYYYVIENECIMKLDGSNRDLFVKMKSELGSNFAVFVRERGLYHNYTADAIQMIKFFNESRKVIHLAGL